MNFFNYPFLLSETENGIQQKFSFLNGKEILSEKNLEKLITLSYNFGVNDYTNLQGLVAEILANQLLEESIGKSLYVENKISGKIISGKENYLINSNKIYFAKLLFRNRIVILKKETFFEDDTKFGFRNVAEIDGLYIIKKERKDRNLKHFIAIETKSGDIKLNAEHIKKDIIFPLQKMYKNDISYIVVGFKENLYTDSKLNILNTKLNEIFYSLKGEGINFTAIHFPFSKEDFVSFISKIESERTGIYSGKGIYNSKSEVIEILLQNGEKIKGKLMKI